MLSVAPASKRALIGVVLRFCLSTPYHLERQALTDLRKIGVWMVSEFDCKGSTRAYVAHGPQRMESVTMPKPCKPPTTACMKRL
ncbi:hypothetical protein BKA83DRAFT_4297186 [Pisolithus microcarpus]|nr:hypothetical protein BKA83DRAFT_4297186 [Pisolithus microcarpus]